KAMGGRSSDSTRSTLQVGGLGLVEQDVGRDTRPHTRQRERETAPDSEATLAPDATTLQLHQPSADVEADARAAVGPGRCPVQLPETLEQVRDVAREDAGPAIGDGHDDVVTLVAHLDVD